MKKMAFPLIQGTNTKAKGYKQTYTILAPNRTPQKPVFLITKPFLSNLKDNRNLYPNSQNEFTNHSVLQSKTLMARSYIIHKKKVLGKAITKPIQDPKTCLLCLQEVESHKYISHINMHPSKIFDWLFLGSYRNASEISDLKKLNMTHVLNCAIECQNNYPRDFSYCHLKLCDRPNFRICLHFAKAVAFLEEVKKSNGKVLVHCQMGISRSTTCVIAYMIREMNYSAVEALKYIKKKRKIVFPNYGFMEQLIQYEKLVRTNQLS